MGARRSVGASLERDGAAVRPVLDGDAVATLAARFAALGIDEDRSLYRSIADEPRPVARSIDADIRAVVEPALRSLLPGHHAILAVFIAKGRGGALMDFHQDWTFTDERVHRAINVWIPLVDVDRRRGGLAVVPGSHRWIPRIRCSSTVAPAAPGPHQAALGRLGVLPSLRAGEALLYDVATVHGSTVNDSDRVRPAVAVVMIPDEAEVLHFHESERGVTGCRLDPDFFTTHGFETEPVGFPAVEPWSEPVRAPDFSAALRGRRRPSWTHAVLGLDGARPALPWG